MEKSFTDRISERLSSLNLSAQKASLQVSKNRDLFRNVLRAGPEANPTRETLSLIAKALNVSETWLLTGNEAARSFDGELRASDIQMPRRDDMPRDVPVMGTAAGSMNGKGAFQISPDVVDWVARPPGLASSRDIYALYIEGDSMEPRFNAGELVFVSPHKPIRVNDAIIIQEPNSNNGVPQAFIKLFLRKTETSIFTRQLNPDCNIEFTRHTGTTIHKVLTTNELFGI